MGSAREVCLAASGQEDCTVLHDCVNDSEERQLAGPGAVMRSGCRW